MNVLRKKKNIIPTLLIVMLFIVFEGFGLIALYSIPLFQYIRLFVLISFFAYYIFVNKHIPFIRPMKLMIVFILISCFYSWKYHGQDLKNNISYACWPYFGLISFYMPYYYKLSSQKTLRIIKNICVIVSTCYIIQYIVYPTEIFVWVQDAININNTTFRPRTYCSLSCYCLMLLSVEEYINKKKLFSIVYFFLGIIPVFIMGFRSLIVLVLLGVVLVVLQCSNKAGYIKYAIIGSVVVFSTLQIPIIQEKLDEMVERQENDQTFENEDYIRYVALAYFTTELHENLYESIFGSGVPNLRYDTNGDVLPSRNKYQNKFYNALSMKLYWNDLGIIGLALLIGIPAVVLMVYFFIWGMRHANKSGLYFVRYCLGVCLLGSIMTSQELYRTGNLIFVGILLYYIYISKNKVIR